MAWLSEMVNPSPSYNCWKCFQTDQSISKYVWFKGAGCYLKKQTQCKDRHDLKGQAHIKEQFLKCIAFAGEALCPFDIKRGKMFGNWVVKVKRGEDLRVLQGKREPLSRRIHNSSSPSKQTEKQTNLQNYRIYFANMFSYCISCPLIFFICYCYAKVFYYVVKFIKYFISSEFWIRMPFPTPRLKNLLILFSNICYSFIFFNLGLQSIWNLLVCMVWCIDLISSLFPKFLPFPNRTMGKRCEQSYMCMYVCVHTHVRAYI